MKTKNKPPPKKNQKEPSISWENFSEIKKEIHKQEERFSTLLDAIPDLVYFKDTRGRNLMVNKAYADYLGRKKEEIIGKKDPEFLDPELTEQCRKSDEEVIKNKRLVRVDEKTQGDAGETIHFNTLKSPITDQQGNIKGLVGISRDLTAIRKNEEQTRKSLKEKEVLLKEIHHRVKNNMQIISSLLNLQASTSPDPVVKEKLNQCRSRIKAMALVHDRLYRSSSLSQIDFSNYIQTLATHLMTFNRGAERNIELDLNLDKIYLDINKSIPLGLITNELISNSLKHAFPEQSLFLNMDKEQKRVQVDLQKIRKNEVELVIKDNGIGLPENYKDKARGNMGINLIKDLVKQINGKMKIESSTGTLIKIKFPL